VSPKRSSSLSRYEEIAVDVATRIVQREWREGQRLFGRSSLAGLYKVSPETIRRAIALLHSHGVVTAVAGSGVVVNSTGAAEQYLAEAKLDAELRGLAEDVHNVLEERRKLDERLSAAIDRLLHHASGALSTVRHVVEYVVPEDSPLVGQTLQSADLRSRTGVTVIGVARKGEEMFSPDPRMPLEPGDLLIVIGSERAKEHLRGLLTRSEEGLQ
jgi:K+/H+ antiporter YhaU regulatory subunit KhtT